MKNLPFGTAEYKPFENTFLSTVFVSMHFAPVENVSDYSAVWAEYTKSLFSIEPLQGLFIRPIAISKKDDPLMYVFTKDFVQVRIGGEEYQTFADTVIPHAYKLKQFVVDVADRDNLTQICIRKIDIFQIEAEEGEIVKEESVRKHFFSENYRKQKNNLRCLNDVENKSLPNMVKHEWDDDEAKLTVRSVFIPIEGKDRRFNLVLDTEEVLAPEDGIAMETIDTKLKDMNLDLFNAYMWCVSDSVKRVMEKGKE